MKKYLLSLFLLTAGFMLPASAADTNAAPAAPTEAVATSPADQLAGFAVEKLKQYTAKGEVAFASGVDTLVVEAPKLVSEFLMWRTIDAAFQGLMYVALIVAVWRGRTFANQLAVKGGLDGDDQMCVNLVAAVIATMLSGLWAFFAVDWLLEVLQIWLVPRVYLLENIGPLLNR